MLHVVWSVCLCVLVTLVYCAKTAEPTEMPFGGLIRQVGDAAMCQITYFGQLLYFISLCFELKVSEYTKYR